MDDTFFFLSLQNWFSIFTFDQFELCAAVFYSRCDARFTQTIYDTKIIKINIRLSANKRMSSEYFVYLHFS